RLAGLFQRQRAQSNVCHLCTRRLGTDLFEKTFRRTGCYVLAQLGAAGRLGCARQIPHRSGRRGLPGSGAQRAAGQTGFSRRPDGRGRRQRSGFDPASMLANARHRNASKVFLNWLLSRDGQMAFQKLTKENSLRVDIPKEGIVDPELMLDPKKQYLFTGMEEHKKKINEFVPWLESLVKKNDR